MERSGCRGQLVCAAGSGRFQLLVVLCRRETGKDIPDELYHKTTL